jgi:NAD(P)-dependent dehydrogenase (short-subunit alcohol dehydrogenase family)
MQELRGKVAVITGAGSGLGRAMAKRFGREGMKLVLADIDQERLHDAANELDEAGVEVQPLKTDVSKQSQVDGLADLAYERFGAVHLLCNNAGVAVVGTAWERSHADWEWAIGVNLWSVVHGIRSFVPRMLEAGQSGHIVNTASVAGLLCPPLSGPYVATKHAVVGLSECLHHDLTLRQSQIGVSVLCPGFVKTRIYESESVRPEDLKNPGTNEDKFAEEINEYYRTAVDSGIDASVVASAVYDAVIEGKYWILTHSEFDKPIRQRFEGILERKNPPTRPLAAAHE